MTTPEQYCARLIAATENVPDQVIESTAGCAPEWIGKLLQGVRNTAKEGKLTLELSIKPARIDMGEVKQVSIKTACKAKVPEADTAMSIFFTGEDNALMRDDPEQRGLFDQVPEDEKEREQVDGP